MPSLFIITGASRGFGRAAACALACDAAAHDRAPPTLLLLARDVAGLDETRALVAAAAPSTTTLSAIVDLSDLLSIPARWRAALAALPPGPWARIVLINNAGSVTPVGCVADLVSDCGDEQQARIAALQHSIDLNVTSPIILSSLFLQFAITTDALDISLVNVSSLCGITPFASASAYCTGKAAREMLHRVIAAEYIEEGGGSARVRTLNYAPGPMDTALLGDMRASPLLHASTGAAFDDLERRRAFVDADDSARKLARVLRGGWVSHMRVDYYDLPDNP